MNKSELPTILPTSEIVYGNPNLQLPVPKFPRRAELTLAHEQETVSLELARPFFHGLTAAMPLVITEYKKEEQEVLRQLDTLTRHHGMYLHVIDAANTDYDLVTAEFILNALDSYEARELVPGENIQPILKELRALVRKKKSEQTEESNVNKSAIKTLFCIKNVEKLPVLIKQAIMTYCGNTPFMPAGEQLRAVSPTPFLIFLEEDPKKIEGTFMLQASVKQLFEHGIPIPTSREVALQRPVTDAEIKNFKQFMPWMHFLRSNFAQFNDYRKNEALAALVHFVKPHLHPLALQTEAAVEEFVKYAADFLSAHQNNGASERVRREAFQSVYKAFENNSDNISETSKEMRTRFAKIIPGTLPEFLDDLDQEQLDAMAHAKKIANSPKGGILREGLRRMGFKDAPLKLKEAIYDLIDFAIAQGAYDGATNLLHGLTDSRAWDARMVLLNEKALYSYIDSFNDVPLDQISAMLKQVTSTLKKGVTKHLTVERRDRNVDEETVRQEFQNALQNPPESMLVIALLLANMHKDQKTYNVALRRELLDFFQGLRYDARPLDLLAKAEGKFVRKRTVEESTVQYSSDQLKANMAYTAAPALRAVVHKLLPPEWKELWKIVQQELRPENLMNPINKKKADPISEEEIANIEPYVEAQFYMMLLFLASMRHDFSVETELQKSAFMEQPQENIMQVMNPIVRITNAQRALEEFGISKGREDLLFNAMFQTQLSRALDVAIILSDEKQSNGQYTSAAQARRQLFRDKYAKTDMIKYLNDPDNLLVSRTLPPLPALNPAKPSSNRKRR